MSFTDTLLAWYDEHKRKLPWRGERDPYKIWVSEIILQQTRVQQGWNYYLNFIDTFPDVQSLATASEDEVLRVWQGLGYYSRARNMHFAAKQIIHDFNGKFPQTYDDIRKLKGIGDYTAAAIGSMAFGLSHPAIDGNALRVISRIYGIFDDISSLRTKRTITTLCNDLIDPNNPGNFNQAMMDFGATHCVPKNPLCAECPFQTTCYAFQNEVVDQLPVKGNTIVKKDRYFHYIFYIIGKETIIEKRDDKDIWRGLYQFPLIETCSAEDRPFKEKPVSQLREVLSHQIIHASFYVKNQKDFPKEMTKQQRIDIEKLPNYPMPKVMVTFLKTIFYK